MKKIEVLKSHHRQLSFFCVPGKWILFKYYLYTFLETAEEQESVDIVADDLQLLCSDGVANQIAAFTLVYQ